MQQNASEAEVFYNATGFLRCTGRGSGLGGESRCLGGLSDKAETAGDSPPSRQTKQGMGADTGVGQAAGRGHQV